MFRREEGKVHKIGSGWHDHWNFCAEKEENLNIRVNIPPAGTLKNVKNAKRKKTKTNKDPSFYYLVIYIVNSNKQDIQKQCKAIYLKILLIIIQNGPDFSDFFPLKTAC